MSRGKEIAFLLIGSLYSPQKALGSDLLGYWDAKRSDLITIATGVSSWKDIIAGYDALQGTGSLQPVYSATSFGGDPGVTFDGIDDQISTATQPFPSGATPSEIWALVQNDVTGVTAGTKVAATYGGSGTSGINARAVSRTPVTNVNRGRGLIGDGAAAQTVTGTVVDLSTRHVMRLEVGAASSTLTIDGTDTATVSVVPNTGSVRFRMGANTAGANFWQGIVAVVMVTNPLSVAKAAALTTYLKNRRRI